MFNAKQIDTVLFDFSNTLAFITPRREEILSNFIDDNTTSKEKILKAYIRTDEDLPYSSIKIKTPSERRLFYEKYNDLLFRRLGASNGHNFYDYCSGIKREWELYEDAIATINFLRLRKIRMGIISNFGKHLNKIVKDLEISNAFDFLSVSEQVGLEKPNIEFYKHAETKYNIDVNNSIYIGDSYSLDYVPASKHGFNSFLIDRSAIYTHVPQRIGSLIEITKQFR